MRGWPTFAAAVAVCCLQASAAGAFSLRDAVQHTIGSHPAVQAAQASRDATAYELRQSQGRLLPRIDLDTDVGAQNIDRPESLEPEENAKWRNRRQAIVTVRQVLFNGWERANDIYRSAARVDAAALRVMERSQALGLDAVEAYIDVRRNLDLVAIAKENLRRHQAILDRVQVRSEGGRAPKSELDQTQERISGAQAIVGQVQQSLLEAIAKYRRVVGLEPAGLQEVPYPPGFRMSREAALRNGVAANPTVQAAEADASVARYEFKRSKGPMLPEIALEGSSTWAEDIDAIDGRNNDVTGRVVLSWTLFEGLIKANRRRELAARWTQAQLERDVRVREIVELIDKSLASLTAGGRRLDALESQLAANRQVVGTYLEEYQLSKRSLLDLLDAEGALFNSSFQLTSQRAVHVFSAYQLLAATGQLLAALNVAPPPEATANHLLQSQSRFGIFNIDIEALRK